ncbi:eukaryotic rRNA processing protein EBP2-domain-containing protein [Gaertneriomyces semiglobifer]|nr:eukaryotic rRNA processing protein EBP2-domain-containing protein [Gaertneriomyces semiglobifer]
MAKSKRHAQQHQKKKQGGGFKKGKKTADEEPAELDVASFIEEQELEMDPEVAELLNEDEPAQVKKASKKRKAKLDNGRRLDMDTEGPVAETDEPVIDDDEAEAELKALLALSGQKETEDDEEDVLVEKVFANNTTALLSRLDDIRLDRKDNKLPWIQIMAITSPTPLDLDAADVDDDLKREQAIYNQAVYAAVEGRKRCRAAGVAFSRPDDYFAEMVKSDEHMAKVRQKLLDEAASMQAAEQARKQRDLKKFGKKVQQEKLAQREKQKKAEIEKVKVARKKHASAEGSREDADDDFGIELEKDNSAGRKAGGKGGPGAKRKRRDEKFGFGGKKKFKKSNTSTSTSDMGGFDYKKMKGKAGVTKNRPGKSRRAGGRGKK